MLIELYINASVLMHTSVFAAADPYPARCEGFKVINPIFAFFIGEVKGVLPTTFFAILFFAGVGATVAISRKVKKESLRVFLMCAVGALALLGLWDFMQSLSPSPCLGK